MHEMNLKKKIEACKEHLVEEKLLAVNLLPHFCVCSSFGKVAKKSFFSLKLETAEGITNCRPFYAIHILLI